MCEANLGKYNLDVDDDVAAPFLKRNAAPILHHILQNSVNEEILQLPKMAKTKQHFQAKSKIGTVYFTSSITSSALRVTNIITTALPLYICKKNKPKAPSLIFDISPGDWDRIYTTQNHAIMSNVSMAYQKLRNLNHGGWVIKMIHDNYRLFEIERFHVWFDVLHTKSNELLVKDFGTLTLTPRPA